MKCPFCKTNASKVVDKRDNDESGIIKRRRECLQCAKRYTTYEKIDLTDLIVIKKNGRKEPFNSEKLRTGIERACEKRPINAHQVETIVNEIEAAIREKKCTEVTSDLIGNETVCLLRTIDKVACIRFASVYKSFQTIDEFEAEVKSLLST